MRLSVDRIENDTVVCMDKDEKIYNVPKKYFPFPCRDGDVIDIIFENDIPVFIALNKAETQKARDTLTEMLEKLRKGRENL